MSYGSSKRRRPNPGRSSTDGDGKVGAVASAVGGGLLLGASAAAAAAAGPVSAGPDGTSSILGTYQAVSIAEEPAKGSMAVKADGKDDGGDGDGVGHSTAAPGDKVPEVQPSRWFSDGDLTHVWGMLTESKINLLFVCLPFAYLSPLFGWGDAATFLFNFGAMIPLASLLGNSTEEVAARTNEIIGGFMNCTLGNIMEVIVSITALRKGYLRVVQTSLLGSVFSNMLLVLGTCFLAGGIVTPNPDKQQKFNRIGATTFSSLLLIACLGLVSPASFINNVNPRPTKADLLVLSRLGAMILGVVYVLYLVFQMKTHSHLFDNDDEADGDGDDGGAQDQGMSLAAGMCVLAAISVATVICSELLVDSLEGAIQSLGLNQVFIGIILLPIIGNAAEHASAVTVAMKDKMDLALGVAIGSSIQIALFVIPLITLVGWAIDQPLTLDFHTFETVVLLVSVLITNVVISSGQANWLAGAMLLAAYVIIAIAFFFHPDTPLVHA